MSSTQFVEMYHPLIPLTITSPALVPMQAVDDRAAKGWLLVDPDGVLPTPDTPYYTKEALLSQIQGGAAPIGTALRAASVAAISLHRQQFPITSYGAVRATYLTGASMTAGSAVLAVSGYSFQTSDVGKVVGVRGAGAVSTDYSVVANDGVLVATIASVSSGQATLSASAATTCSGVPCAFGTPIDTALAAAIADCTAQGGGTVYFPAGTWLAQAAQPFGSRVSFAGAGRGNSTIYVAKVAPSATDPTTAAWLRSSGAGAGGRYVEVNLSDFTADGSFFACSGPYGADLKMIHIAGTANSTVERIASTNNPATALGYDNSINCLIANNIITNPGRLAAPSSSSGSPGGSGIGVAVGGSGDLSMVIRDNRIKGLWTPSGGTGRSGINIEAASSTDIPNTYTGGVQISNNFIEGMFNGIVDSGAAGTIIEGNTVRRCNSGIRLGTNGITNGSAARDAVVVGNVVENGISGAGYDGVGIAVNASGAGKDTRGRTLIADNMVRSIDGYGIRVVGGTFPAEHVMVRGNAVRDSGLFGIQVVGTVNDLAVVGNSVTGSGQRSATTSKDAIDVASGAVWTDGRLESNDFYDYATTPTQNNRYDTAGATLTGVKVSGNTGDLSSSGDVFGRKTSTTTITNTTTMATVSALALAVTANATYEVTAMVEYTSTAAAGIKLGWSLPSGATINWEASGPGAPTIIIGTTGTASLSGIDGAASIAAILKGFLVVNATAGNVQLTAAQATATADSTTVTTKTNLALRKVA